MAATAPFLCFTASYGGMFLLAKKFPTIFGRYNDWMRLQILLWYEFCKDDPMVRDLIWVNAMGNMITAHLMYFMTRYELLHFWTDYFFKFVVGFPINVGLYISLATDLTVQGLPVLFAYGVLKEKGRPLTPPLPHIWLLTAVPHALYVFLLTGGWDIKPLYGVSLKNFKLYDNSMVFSVVSGHFIAYLMLYCFTSTDIL
jgi:hypothetical protein